MIRTTRDIIIPAGTELVSPPLSSTRWGKDYEAIIGIDTDHTCYLTMDLDEGYESGIIEEVDDPSIGHEFVGFKANPGICSICGAVKPFPCYDIPMEKK